MWINTPRYTRALALTFLDPDAPSDSPVVHWALINLPPEIMLLPDDVSQTGLPEGAWETLTYLDLPGYQGPCPPEGQRHRYIFTLYALKKKIPEPDEPVYLADIQELIDDYTLKSTELLAYFPAP
jgi:Raf kinase inhibitor-like YbhB/YbcL family protein